MCTVKLNICLKKNILILLKALTVEWHRENTSQGNVSKDQSSAWDKSSQRSITSIFERWTFFSPVNLISYWASVSIKPLLKKIGLNGILELLLSTKSSHSSMFHLLKRKIVQNKQLYHWIFINIYIEDLLLLKTAKGMGIWFRIFFSSDEVIMNKLFYSGFDKFISLKMYFKYYFYVNWN